MPGLIYLPLVFLDLLILLVVSQLYGDFVALFLLFCIALRDIALYQYIHVCLLYSFWSSC